ncbi:MAG: ABC transporter permease [Clostridiaceae bacterium]|nr:ABC transporter permease [Clostridiaceae bacterium]
MKTAQLMLTIIKKQRNHYRFSLILVSAGLALLVLLISSMQAILLAYETNKVNLYGEQHGLLIHCSDRLISNLTTDKHVAQIGTAAQFGYVSAFASSNKYVVTVGYLDDSFKQLAKIGLVNGRWPQAANEIAIEQTELIRLGYSSKIGDTLKIPIVFEDSTSAARQCKEIPLTLVGIIKDYSYMQYHPPEVASSPYKLPGIVVGQDFTANLGCNASSSKIYSVKLSTGTTYIDFFHRLAADYKLSFNDYYLNTAVYKMDAALEVDNGAIQTNCSSYFSDNTYKSDAVSDYRSILLILSAIVILSVLFAVLSAQILLWGKLRIIIQNLRFSGAGLNHALAFTCLQSLLSMVYIIPTGIVAGLILNGMLSRFILPSFIDNFIPVVDGVSIILTTILFIGLIITANIGLVYKQFLKRPLETVSYSKFRGTDDKNSELLPVSPAVHISRLERKPLLLWAAKSFRGNQASMAGILLALTMSFVSVIFGSFLLARQQSSFAFYSGFDYILRNDGNAESPVNSLEIPFNFPDGFSPEELDNLFQNKNISKYYSVTSMPVDLVCSDYSEQIQQAKDLGWTDTGADDYYQREMIAGDKELYGFSSDEHIFISRLSGVSTDRLHDLDPYIVSGEIIDSDLNAGQSVVLVTSGKNAPITVGGQLNLSQIIMADQDSSSRLEIAANPKFKRVDLTVTVAAIVVIPADETALMKVFGGKPATLFWGDTAFHRFGLTLNPHAVYLDISQPDLSAASQAITRLHVLYPDMTLFSQSAEDQAAADQAKTLIAIIFAVLTALIFFTILNMIAYNQTNIRRNARLFGALRASGFSFDIMKKYKIIESAMIVIFSFLCASIVSVAAIIAFAGNTTGLTTDTIKTAFFHYPYAEILIAIPLMIMIFYAAGIVPMKKVYNTNISDLMRV